MPWSIPRTSKKDIFSLFVKEDNIVKAAYSWFSVCHDTNLILTWRKLKPSFRVPLLSTYLECHSSWIEVLGRRMLSGISHSFLAVTCKEMLWLHMDKLLSNKWAGMFCTKLTMYCSKSIFFSKTILNFRNTETKHSILCMYIFSYMLFWRYISLIITTKRGTEIILESTRSGHRCAGENTFFLLPLPIDFHQKSESDWCSLC